MGAYDQELDNVTQPEYKTTITVLIARAGEPESRRAGGGDPFMATMSFLKLGWPRATVYE